MRDRKWAPADLDLAKEMESFHGGGSLSIEDYQAAINETYEFSKRENPEFCSAIHEHSGCGRQGRSSSHVYRYKNPRDSWRDEPDTRTFCLCGHTEYFQEG